MGTHGAMWKWKLASKYPTFTKAIFLCKFVLKSSFYSNKINIGNGDFVKFPIKTSKTKISTVISGLLASISTIIC